MGMLSLSRKTGERIYIGDDIIVSVADIKKGRVVLGIQAPLNLAIWREEIYKKLKEEMSDMDKYLSST